MSFCKQTKPVEFIFASPTTPNSVLCHKVAHVSAQTYKTLGLQHVTLLSTQNPMSQVERRWCMGGGQRRRKAEVRQRSGLGHHPAFLQIIVLVFFPRT